MIEAHFGESPQFSLGVEEELMILDADTLLPTAGVEALVRGAEGLELPGTLKTELHASVVELNTCVCETVDEAIDALRRLRAAAHEIARENGLVLAAAGAHPVAALESLPVVQEPRYLEMLVRVGYPARRQGVNGLHVHVGVESARACHERSEALLGWLPVVLALSANSPFVDGVANGMLSNRAGVLAELPRGGAPPAFDSYADWEAWVERLVALGVMADYTRVWWDVRPHPTFGTLEIRVADQPTSPARTELLVRLLRDLVEAAPPLRTPRGDYAQNRVAAASFGLDAELIHPEGDRVVTARGLARELLGSEPPEPEALAQLQAGDSVAADLVARTLT
ncbi:MAG: glutamate---cysteine ligase / carboxylate-amine ligase [Gaiellaceae bacterium]|nr:glutamate---cysteine ligase / carboxylate-amine ligase [Gaiellaceae bacterium]